jgi:hypothetical protein
MEFRMLDANKTALLTLDCQMGIFDLIPGAEAIIQLAARAVEFAREPPVTRKFRKLIPRSRR